MEKMVTLFILLLIIAVAGFNLVSGLVMMVTDKRSDIAILRTLGATAKHIMGIFIAQGLMIGSMGVLLGVSFGLIVAYYITPWVDFLEHTFNIDLIAKNVYAVNFLPSEIHTHDVLQVVILTFGICMVATIYPAWRAAHIQPAEALRYE
jgi:lipoprotein-releasing system permease protein